MSTFLLIFSLLSLFFISISIVWAQNPTRLNILLAESLCAQYEDFQSNGTLASALMNKTEGKEYAVFEGEAQWKRCGESGSSCRPFEIISYLPRQPSDDNLFYDDIYQYPPGYYNESRNVVPDYEYRWPDRTMFYAIDDKFSAQQKYLISLALKDLNNNTCIRIKQQSTGDYVFFEKSDVVRCDSQLGRQGGRQPLRLHPRCFHEGPGGILHEIMHALGFDHEHCRSDRDDYVIIHENRILTDKLDQFRKQPTFYTLGHPYDYKSILHFAADTFARKKGDITIEALNGMTKLGSRLRLTDLDYYKINDAYACRRSANGRYEAAL